MFTIFPDAIRHKLKNVLDKSGLKYRKSDKKEGTIVIFGKIVKELIKDSEILKEVDAGSLNIWQSELNGYNYSMIQKRPGMKPRRRDFGTYNENDYSLSELRELSKKTAEVDANHPELYPWQFKLKLTKTEDYYNTPDWAEFREKYYSLKANSSKSCQCCDQLFLGDESLLLNIHHKITIKNGGSNDKTNLTSLCVACHTLVHYDKPLLINSLFIYYAETGKVGNDKIKKTLLHHDDIVSAYSPQSTLQTYERFVAEFDRKEAKQYFLNKIYTGFRYRNKSMYSNAAFYFKPTLQPNESNSIFVEEPLYDMSAICLIVFSLCDRATFFMTTIQAKGGKNSNLQKHLDNTNDELSHYSNILKKKIIDGHITLQTLSDLFLIVKEKKSMVFGNRSGKDAFDPTDQSSYMQKAIERRNNIYSTSVLALCSQPLEDNSTQTESENQTRKRFYEIFSALSKEGNVKYSYEEILKSNNAT